MIKHIVISGGGHSILSFYGTMKESNIKKYRIIKTLSPFMDHLLEV